jgi:predicted dehydrogenase
MKKAQNKKPGLMDRRTFIRNAGIASSALMIVPRHVLGGPGFMAPSDKLNIAIVGAGGMGANNTRNCATDNIVALCDVDDEKAKEIYGEFPKAARYKDFRVMLEKQKDIEAVVVATPDHTHAVVALAAMQLGKHVYVQKPLTRTVHEARQLLEASRKYRVQTQMGNQHHSCEGIRLICEWIADGAIGEIREVHTWTDRPVWPQGMGRPAETPGVPAHFDWDLWLGPAPDRPYHPVYHPFKWRGWRDFGTGALGDMGCHVIDAAFWALNLRYPTSIEASRSYDVPDDWTRFENKETFPRASIVRYSFPEREGLPPVQLNWYDGGLLPQRPAELEPGRRMTDGGTIFVGSKGIILGTDTQDSPRIVPEAKMRAYQRPEKTIPRVKGDRAGHEQDWIRACKEGKPASSNFEYSALLSETVVLGNLALFFPGEKLEWDGENMRVTNNEEANSFVKQPARQGWSI